jgi:hypothetical protein
MDFAPWGRGFMSELMAIFEKAAFREHAPAGQGPRGLERGVVRMELRRIPGDPRITPPRRGGGKEAPRG